MSWTGDGKNIMQILTGKSPSEWLKQGSVGDAELAREIRAAVIARKKYSHDDVSAYTYLRSGLPTEEGLQILYSLRKQFLRFINRCIEAGGIYHG